MKKSPPLFGLILFGVVILSIVVIVVFAIINRDDLVDTFTSNTSDVAQSSETLESSPTNIDAVTPNSSMPEEGQAVAEENSDEDEDSSNLATDNTVKPAETLNDTQEDAINADGPVSITITRAVIENETLSVRTSLSTVEAGSCTLMASLSDGTNFTSQPVATGQLNGSSTCQGFDIPFLEFGSADGVSDIEIIFTSESGVSSSSGVQSYEIFI